MQARVEREGDITIIHLSGRLDVETAEPFRESCLKYLNQKKVVFDFKALSFVGSSGILPFLEAMQKFAVDNAGLFNFSGVGTEFRRVFAATSLGTVQIFETPIQAAEELIRPRPVPIPLATPQPILQTEAATVAPLVSAPSESAVAIPVPSTGQAEIVAPEKFGFLNLSHHTVAED